MLLNVALEKEVKQKKNLGLNPYAYHVKGDKKPSFSLRSVCFVEARFHPPISAFAISLVKLGRKKRNKGVLRFLKYVIERSPWKAAYNGRTLIGALRYGIPMNMKVDHSFMIAAAIAVRESWEFSKYVNTWNFLVDKGIDEDFAYLICRYLSYDKRKKWFFPETTGGHSVLGEIPFLERNYSFLAFKSLRNAPPIFSGRRESYSIFYLTETECGWNVANSSNSWLLSGEKQMRTMFGYTEGFSVEESLENIKLYEKEFLEC